MLRTASALLGLLSLTAAAPAVEVEVRATDQPGCTSFKFPVTASATNFKFSVPANIGKPQVLEDFIISSGSAIAGGALQNAATSQMVNGTFMMAAIYCEPTKWVPSRANTIQYLQHAITMRKEYWNGLTYPVGFDGETYSYMTVARANGYPIIAVDNLGTGASEHPDPIDVTQQIIQVEVIHGIIQKLRDGTVGGPIGSKKFWKVIYVGHSYGSICGNGIATHYPKDVDAFVFTGYSAQFALGAGPLAEGILLPADLVMPARYGSLNPGYLAMSSEKGRSASLYTAPNSLGGFAAGAPIDDFKNEGTGAIGEIATLLYGVGPADDYEGYVFVVTGERDAIVCNVPPTPYCGKGANSIPARAAAFFPKAKDYSYHIPGLTGHDANLHYSSPESFKLITAYLASNGF